MNILNQYINKNLFYMQKIIILIEARGKKKNRERELLVSNYQSQDSSVQSYLFGFFGFCFWC